MALGGYQVVRIPRDARLAAGWDGRIDRTVQPWRDDAGFRALWERVAGQTIVDEVRAYMLYQLLRQTEALAGDAAEFGVYKGGSAKLIAQAAPARTLHLFDTFEGMPPVNPAKDPFSRPGDFADVSVDKVAAYLADCPNVRFHPGFFPDTTRPFVETIFSFVHVDVVIHQSVLDACRFFYPRLVPGGVIVFDDYGFELAAGAKAAVDEYFAGKPEQPILLPTGQGVVIRL